MSDHALERERRQLRLMRDRLTGFQVGEVPLPRVIADLEALVWALELAEETWLDEFIEEWSVLEIEYAVALDRQTPLPGPAMPDIVEAVRNLIAMVDARRAELGEGANDEYRD